MAHQLVDEVHRLGRAGLEHAGREHQLHGIDGPRLPDRAAGAAKTGEDTEVDFGEADPRRLIVDRDAIVAGQRQFQPAAEAKAVNARHHRHLEVFDAGEQCMGALQSLGQHREIAHRVELADVRASDKAAVLAAEQHHADHFARIGQILDPRHQCFELHDRFAAERIDRGIGGMDRQPTDLFNIGVEAPVLGLGCL